MAKETKVHQERMSKIPYIEGKPELFETKILRVKQSSTENAKNILAATRDLGSGKALMPVLRELLGDEDVQVDIATDGLAQEVVQKQFDTTDITPSGMILEADNVIGTPDVIIMDRSGETGVDNYLLATFPEVPKVLIEDIYGNAAGYLSTLRERELPLPDKICVMDNGAKELIVKEFPDLADRVVVTGQPAFDRFAHEDTEKIAQETRTKLKLRPEDKLVVFMSSIDEPDKIAKMAAALKQSGENFYFVFRRHPKDNVSYETYKRMLVDAGINVLDTKGFTSDEISAAADVVLTTWSTEGINAIYRRKPTAHITDTDFEILAGYELPLVPVRLGASVGIDNMNDLTKELPQLLDPNSALNKSLKEKMEQEYPVDGNSAKRVADIVRAYLEK